MFALRSEQAPGMNRKAYPGDVSYEWVFVALCLTLMAEEERQRMHSMREVFHGL